MTAGIFLCLAGERGIPASRQPPTENKAPPHFHRIQLKNIWRSKISETLIFFAQSEIFFAQSEIFFAQSEIFFAQSEIFFAQSEIFFA